MATTIQKQTENLLNSFYDLPERLTQLHAELEHLHDALQAASSSAVVDYYQKEIAVKKQQLEHLQHTQHAIESALSDLSRTDRRIVELAYLGPKDPKARLDWLQRPTWYSIAADMGMSVSQVTMRATRILKSISTSLIS